MRQELLLDMGHYNAGWKCFSWITWLDLPCEIMCDRRITRYRLALQIRQCLFTVSAFSSITTYSYDKPSYGLSDIKLAIHWVNCSCSTNMLRFILVVQLLANRPVGGTAAPGLQYSFANFQFSHTIGYNPFTHSQLRVRRDSDLQVSGVRMSSTGYISRS